MDFKTFKALYESTFAYEQQLDKFWSSYLYDAECSLDDYGVLSKETKKNALFQRQMLEDFFQEILPTTLDDLMKFACTPDELGNFLSSYPDLQKKNEGKIMLLVKALPVNDSTKSLGLLTL